MQPLPYLRSGAAKRVASLRHSKERVAVVGETADLLDTLPADIQQEVLRHVGWSARATCHTFRQELELSRQHLRVKWPSSRKDAAQFRAMLERLPKLTDLAAVGCPTRHLRMLPGLPALTALNLSSSAMLEDIRPLAALTALRTLKLDGCTKVEDIRPLGSLTALTCLDMYACYQVSDMGPLASCVALKQLLLGSPSVAIRSALAGVAALAPAPPLRLWSFRA